MALTLPLFRLMAMEGFGDVATPGFSTIPARGRDGSDMRNAASRSISFKPLLTTTTYTQNTVPAQTERSPTEYDRAVN